MLAKRYRLPIQEFAGKRGKLAKTPYFLMKSFNSEGGFSRFGVTVSTKVSKNASRRNQIKRTAFNFLKGIAKSLPIADYWITVLPNAADLPKKRFVAELDKIIK